MPAAAIPARPRDFTLTAADADGSARGCAAGSRHRLGARRRQPAARDRASRRSGSPASWSRPSRPPVRMGGARRESAPARRTGRRPPIAERRRRRRRRGAAARQRLGGRAPRPCSRSTRRPAVTGTTRRRPAPRGRRRTRAVDARGVFSGDGDRRDGPGRVRTLTVDGLALDSVTTRPGLSVARSLARRARARSPASACSPARTGSPRRDRPRVHSG